MSTQRTPPPAVVGDRLGPDPRTIGAVGITLMSSSSDLTRDVRSMARLAAYEHSIGHRSAWAAEEPPRVIGHVTEQGSIEAFDYRATFHADEPHAAGEGPVATLAVMKTPAGPRVYFAGQVQQRTADLLEMKLSELRAILQSTGTESPIELYLTSPGGEVTAGWQFVDFVVNDMNRSSTPIHTVVRGMAASFGALWALAGERRGCTEHAQILLHGALLGIGGSGPAYMSRSSLLSAARHIEKFNQPIFDYIARRIGREPADVKRMLMHPQTATDPSRDHKIFDASQAMKMGLVDHVVGLEEHAAEMRRGAPRPRTGQTIPLRQPHRTNPAEPGPLTPAPIEPGTIPERGPQIRPHVLPPAAGPATPSGGRGVDAA